MDPRKWLEELCRRHGLEADQHADLLPLAERAAAGPLHARRDCLALIGEALRLRAIREQESPGHRAALDQRLLLAVARALHGWAPRHEDSERGWAPRHEDSEGEADGLAS